MDHRQAAHLRHIQLDGADYYKKIGLLLTIVYTRIDQCTPNAGPAESDQLQSFAKGCNLPKQSFVEGSFRSVKATKLGREIHDASRPSVLSIALMNTCAVASIAPRHEIPNLADLCIPQGIWIGGLRQFVQPLPDF